MAPTTPPTTAPESFVDRLRRSPRTPFGVWGLGFGVWGLRFEVWAPLGVWNSAWNLKLHSVTHTHHVPHHRPRVLRRSASPISSDSVWGLGFAWGLGLRFVIGIWTLHTSIDLDIIDRLITYISPRRLNLLINRFMLHASRLGFDLRLRFELCLLLGFMLSVWTTLTLFHHSTPLSSPRGLRLGFGWSLKF